MKLNPKNPIPKVVELHCHPMKPSESAVVEVTDFATGDFVCREPLYHVAAFLKEFGYTWLVGTQGLWQRAGV